MGQAVKETLFHFVCQAPAHSVTIEAQTAPSRASPIVVHHEKWAYCPAGASAGHDWRAVTPVSLADLRRVGLTKI
jgi:hypothetical protein